MSKITFINPEIKLQVKNQMIELFEEYKHKPLTNKLGDTVLCDKMFTFFKIKYNVGNDDTHQSSFPIEVVSEVIGALYQISDHAMEYSGL